MGGRWPAEREFDRVFREKGAPSQVEEHVLKTTQDKIWIVRLLTTTGMASSSSEARRLIQQGGVSIDGERITDVNLEVDLGREFILKVGKRRFLKIRKG